MAEFMKCLDRADTFAKMVKTTIAFVSILIITLS